jgi:hypothetical protein
MQPGFAGFLRGRIRPSLDDGASLGQPTPTPERRGPVGYPLRDEEWGVRRFMLRDPSGTVVNVLSHIPR